MKILIPACYLSNSLFGFSPAAGLLSLTLVLILVSWLYLLAYSWHSKIPTHKSHLCIVFWLPNQYYWMTIFLTVHLYAQIYMKRNQRGSCKCLDDNKSHNLLTWESLPSLQSMQPRFKVEAENINRYTQYNSDVHFLDVCLGNCEPQQ